MLYAMISTKNSQQFTAMAIDSLRRNTPLARGDIVVVIDNDGTLPDIDGVTVIRHDKPRSFAQNANLAISWSRITGHDLWLLNNDIVFTPHWLSRSYMDGRSIIVPNCNQFSRYALGDFEIGFAMDLEDFGGRFDELNEIAEIHAMTKSDTIYRSSRLISFYCVYLPLSASTAIGNFDESFGPAGGEDVDYRFRAMELGIEVKVAWPPFLLHFLGKSTWRSGEQTDARAHREASYVARFIEKWGEPLAQMFLMGGDKQLVAERYGVIELFDKGDFVTLFQTLRRREPLPLQDVR